MITYCTVESLDTKETEIPMNQEIQLLSKTHSYNRGLDLAKPIYYVGHDTIGAQFSNQLNVGGERTYTDKYKDWDYLYGSTQISFTPNDTLSRFY